MHFTLLLVACGPHPEPPAPKPEIAVSSVPTVLELVLPPSLDPAQALQLAALEANLGEVDALVVEVAGQRTPAHRYAPADATVTAQVHAAEPLALDLCVASVCTALEGDAAELTAQVASHLEKPFNPRTVWHLPEPGTRAEPLMRQAASVLYGFTTGAPRARLGSKRDPVAQGPRELGATPLAAWMQGRRDLALGRNKLAADVLDGVRRQRDTERSRHDAVVAYLDAAWIDEAWERLRGAPTGDLRTLLVLGHAAVLRGRLDRAAEVLDALPAHPETSRLAFSMHPERAEADAWLAAWPTDPRAQHAVADLVVRQGGAAPTPALVRVGELARALESELNAAAAADRAASVAQNTYATARAQGAVPCTHPVVGQIAAAEAAGAEQRDHTERARTLLPQLDAARAELAPDLLGQATLQYFASLTERLDQQLRAAKVLRSYQLQVLRCEGSR